MNITLARVVETCAACPSQWDAWTTDGQYLYLRYRSGVGTVDAYDAPGPDGWTRVPDGSVARFEDPDDPLCGEITLKQFCGRAGLVLAPGAVSVPDDPRWEWIYVGTHDDPNQWVRGRCNHLNPVPVQQPAHLGGAVVAYLCTDCDTQLPAEWRHASNTPTVR